MSLDEAIAAIGAFQGENLTRTLSSIEAEIAGLGGNRLSEFHLQHRVDTEFMQSALKIKGVAGQINVIIHAAGILLSLPSLLRSSEVVQKVSLGAGNTGKSFDLETNLRIAEYKFIDWQGGAEAIRQNTTFKDFYSLAEFETTKEKYLYVVGTDIPLKFFRGGRRLKSVLSRHPSTFADLTEKYGDNLATVRDYYELKKDQVSLCDISPHIGRDT